MARRLINSLQSLEISFSRGADGSPSRVNNDRLCSRDVGGHSLARAVRATPGAPRRASAAAMNFLKKGLAQVSAAVEKATGASSDPGARGANLGGTRGPAGVSPSETRGAGGGADPPAPPRAIDPAALPEIRFDDRDDREAHVAFLWTVLEGAGPPGSPPREDALAAFLRGFVATYRDWHPAPDPLSSGSPGARPPGPPVLLGCALGHPASVLRLLVAELAETRARWEGDARVPSTRLGEKKAPSTPPPPAPSPAPSPRDLDLVRAVALASRSERNRALLRRDGAVIRELVPALRSASRRLGRVAARDERRLERHPKTPEGATEDDAWGSEVAPHLDACAALVDALALTLECPGDETELSPRVDGAPSDGFRSSDASGSTSASGSRSAALGDSSPATRAWLECGGFAAAAETIRALRRVAAQTALASTPAFAVEAGAEARRLERVLLRVLASAVDGSTTAQNALRASGGLETLAEGVGDEAADEISVVSAAATDGRDAPGESGTARDADADSPAGGRAPSSSASTSDAGTPFCRA